MTRCSSPDNNWSDVFLTVQKFAGGRGYRRAADVSSFCTLADRVVVQMIRCTNNGGFRDTPPCISHKDCML